MTDQPGPTGEYPDGQLNANDQGETVVKVQVRHGLVFMEFGSAIAWTAMKPEQALRLAILLSKNAKEAIASDRSSIEVH